MSDFTRDAESCRAEKVALRGQLLALRRSKTPDTLADAATRLQQALESHVRHQSPTVIATYVPIGAEPGGPDLLEALRRAAPTASVLLPVLMPDGDLDWAPYEGRSSLRPGPRGLLEPAGPRLGTAAVSEAELVVVPALAVDRRGIRMGRGGGSYDRALARVPVTTFTVALLHDGELLAEVPAEPHDRRVHAAITPGEGLSERLDWTK
ncbi:5-formyltetrahydrofolate cyclo-ligase [Couchioplanes caeruleus]|uniref:5-formyltetrahydrofolate cyclo-ligase n=2 Tax=Couchioplanes caeruleus TaxID=56438 RepID=A0A1K0FSP0_9ACTN|nr:5-formyltetrahydrofolate cyclo-ligase [Couchioplanes caeruleus]OJF15696.1 5-formyltetrahydrofolate cyclo-ligase [Couchioplanes caeruleus subsp. caeruleus]ROP31828.1 5-formyltetrahydrofolate cyclo-ligase [Couchioplanes caeruleus]